MWPCLLFLSRTNISNINSGTRHPRPSARTDDNPLYARRYSNSLVSTDSSSHQLRYPSQSISLHNSQSSRIKSPLSEYTNFDESETDPLDGSGSRRFSGTARPLPSCSSRKNSLSSSSNQQVQLAHQHGPYNQEFCQSTYRDIIHASPQPILPDVKYSERPHFGCEISSSLQDDSRYNVHGSIHSRKHRDSHPLMHVHSFTNQQKVHKQPTSVEPVQQHRRRSVDFHGDQPYQCSEHYNIRTHMNR